MGGGESLKEPHWRLVTPCDPIHASSLERSQAPFIPADPWWSCPRDAALKRVNEVFPDGTDGLEAEWSHGTMLAKHSTLEGY